MEGVEGGGGRERSGGWVEAEDSGPAGVDDVVAPDPRERDDRDGVEVAQEGDAGKGEDAVFGASVEHKREMAGVGVGGQRGVEEFEGRGSTRW